MKQLTKAEEEVMQVLWKLEKASVKAMIKEFPDPKPAYNTVSTIVRILETKGFVDHEQRGKGYLYFPVVAKEEYSNQSINSVVEKYFQGSFKSMVSFFVKKNDLSMKEMEEIMKEIEKNKEL
ncbi:BlaI/MecI/CopY family transcriptional regulator [Robertkochia sediminum]|uniref:BlaI/MecI/CopY family transcriptional regulator n=1 Tax=Robertkochia sediminum TaxID=2785326 RepID=UPI001932F898|nr:BlaI/MecI/CopY family transcriptional regulator [Robertkochia sediminum]MBL7473876.1 BlaI/MecI/CopY family transcriptional regulator [Robertkochia sediminum]